MRRRITYKQFMKENSPGKISEGAGKLDSRKMKLSKNGILGKSTAEGGFRLIPEAGGGGGGVRAGKL